MVLISSSTIPLTIIFSLTSGAGIVGARRGDNEHLDCFTANTLDGHKDKKK